MADIRSPSPNIITRIKKAVSIHFPLRTTIAIAALANILNDISIPLFIIFNISTALVREHTFEVHADGEHDDVDVAQHCPIQRIYGLEVYPRHEDQQGHSHFHYDVHDLLQCYFSVQVHFANLEESDPKF